MRTTIELPENLKQKLAAEAATRNMKGYSKIITEAIVEYFKTGHNERKCVVERLKGCLSKEEYKKEMARLAEGRANWRE